MRFRPGIFCFLLIAINANAQDTTKPAGVHKDTAQFIYVKDTTYPTRKMYRLNKSYVFGYWTDLKHVVSRPAHWNGNDWGKFAIFLGVTGATMAADWEIRHIVLANQGSVFNETAKAVEPFGNLYGVYLFPVMYVAGLVTKEKRMQSVALGGVKSLAISTLIYASTKLLIRRARPDATESSFDYGLPFTHPTYTSSPSGHSNTIFTVATALALEYRETKWVPIVAYTIAGLTAASRIYQNRHWASDVVLGSALGHFVTKAVWKNSNKKKPPKQLW